MLPVSSKETIRFTPEERKKEENAPVYLLEVPTLRGRTIWRRAIRACGIKSITESELLETLREGIETAVDEQSKKDWLKIVDEFIACKENKNVSKELGQEFIKIEETMSSYLPYAKLLAERGYNLDIQNLEAVKHFLIGWENVDVEFIRHGQAVPDNALEKIPEADVSAIGFKILSMMFVPVGEAKNSKSPSQ